jgi:hypothetical protein
MSQNKTKQKGKGERNSPKKMLRRLVIKLGHEGEGGYVLSDNARVFVVHEVASAIVAPLEIAAGECVFISAVGS